MAQLPFPPLRLRRVALRSPARILSAVLAASLAAVLAQAQGAEPSQRPAAAGAAAQSDPPAGHSATSPADSAANHAAVPGATPGAASGATSGAAPGATSGASPAAAGADDAWLKKTGGLYYSSARAGLGGFDCTVHPDWRTLFLTAAEGSTIPDDDARILVLKTVKINLHAHMQGGSTLEWNQDPGSGKPPDDDTAQWLARMHQVTEQSLEGFLQFWTPFMDGSVVPESADGLAITHTGTVHTIHAEQGGTALTEIFSSDLLLEHFDVKMSGISIQFQPAYKPTDQGLLVSSFQAHVQPAGVAAGQAEDMHVDIEYQILDGFPIPSRLNMDVTNTGKFSFVLDGCTVSRERTAGPANEVKPALQ